MSRDQNANIIPKNLIEASTVPVVKTWHKEKSKMWSIFYQRHSKQSVL